MQKSLVIFSVDDIHAGLLHKEMINFKYFMTQTAYCEPAQKVNGFGKESFDWQSSKWPAVCWIITAAVCKDVCMISSHYLFYV